jgi:hypothetical protein
VAGAAIFAIQHSTTHPGHGTMTAGAGNVIKPSQFKQETGSRKIASAAGRGERDSVTVAHHDEDEDSATEPKEATRPRERDSSNHEATADWEHTGTAEAPRAPAAEKGPSVALEGAANDAVATGADCAQIEYRGDGPEQTKVTKGEWTTVMDQFHAAKRDLLSWLEKHRQELSEASAQAMERQVRNLKIQRPPASDEPDLAWRGIGVYSQTSEGDPMIKLGGGFVRMAARHPARAKFEMVRLVAQAWAPCELQRVSALDSTWSPLLRCLGMADNQSCGQGTYSEAGWAVSTTLAALIQSPGCQVPAFRAADGAKCMGHIPFSKTTARAATPAREVASQDPDQAGAAGSQGGRR